MSSVENDERLLEAVFDRNYTLVMAALEVGASVNGPPEAHCPPIAAATMVNRADMVAYFLHQGADPDRSVAINRPCASSGVASAVPGERALHIAGRSGCVEIIRVLLKQSRADPNATDNTGCTPLTAICKEREVRMEGVRLLLEAGADPALAEENGSIPLHGAALHGNLNLVDILYNNVPATLNRRASNGMTPLFMACKYGHENMVSKLLLLGAMQRVPSSYSDVCPLTVSVQNGFVGVVQVLVNEGGLRAVGGGTALSQALHFAIFCRRARILRLLLTAGRGEGRSKWANNSHEGVPLLHYGASFGHPAAVGILLEAGADETVRDLIGRIPRDTIGVSLGRRVQCDRGKKTAISRMLQRGPAYRARSWAWPSDEEAEACGSGEGGAAATAGAGAGDGAVSAAARTGAVLSSPPAGKPPPVIRVRIFRPNETGSSKFFARLIGRYCTKDQPFIVSDGSRKCIVDIGGILLLLRILVCMGRWISSLRPKEMKRSSESFSGVAKTR